jgi:hypothetical protein
VVVAALALVTLAVVPEPLMLVGLTLAVTAEARAMVTVTFAEAVKPLASVTVMVNVAVRVSPAVKPDAEKVEDAELGLVMAMPVEPDARVHL